MSDTPGRHAFGADAAVQYPGLSATEIGELERRRARVEQAFADDAVWHISLEPLASHHHPDVIAADAAARTKKREWLKARVTHRLFEVMAGRPDPQDAVLAGPPKG